MTTVWQFVGPKANGKKVEMLLVIFFVGFGFCSGASSSSSEVARSDSNNLNIRSSGFKMYILEPYFQKYERFNASNLQDYIAEQLLHCSSKLPPDNPNDFLRLSILNRQLIGEGSHRHLYSSIKVHFQSESMPQIPNFTICKVIVLEGLPSGVFADPFELQGLLQRGVFTDVAVFGDTNLELPSFASNQSVVEVHMNISSNILLGQRNELEINIELPLHARYPAMDESGYSKIEFGTPDLLMSCHIEGNLTGQRCLLPGSHVRVESNAGTLTWRIPSGTREHAGMVSVFTFVTAFISTLVIVMTSLSSSYINRTKTFNLL